jgi:probable HAF family extracellular repeat protein
MVLLSCVVTAGCGDSAAPVFTASELDATASAPAVAATWTPQLLNNLPGAPGNCCSLGKAINAAGDVAGMATASNGRSHAVRWQGTTPLDLGVPAGYVDSDAIGINDAGTIVGVATRTAAPVQAGFVWTPAGGMTLLTGPGPSPVETVARDVNNAGTIIGELAVGAQMHAFRYTPAGGYVDLHPAGYVGSSAWAVAENGAVAGYVRPTAGTLHPAYWAPNGTFTDLGTMGGDSSYAFGVNSLGMVVGAATQPSGVQLPFLWQAATGMKTVTSPGQGRAISDGRRVAALINGGVTIRAASKLGAGPPQILPPVPGQVYSSAFGVNRCGSIAGLAAIQGRMQATRWVIAACDP